MLGSTLTITMDGSGGTAKVLPLVNQDNYSSEYYLDEGLVTYTAKVRHTAETSSPGKQAFDRHNVTFSRFVKPVAPATLGSLSEVTYTIRNDPSGVAAEIIDLSEAMSFYMVKAGGIAAKLLGKES
ncbi:MAG: putative coat protein [Alvestavirus fundivicinum]|uniref:Coat protein n=1 Tax=Leviviridae sp. TaxID=2027243 RepID=A0ABY3SUY2_9VIRU|nr:MAG: putative coat protein [Leviviridae sp.]